MSQFITCEINKTRVNNLREINPFVATLSVNVRENLRNSLTNISISGRNLKIVIQWDVCARKER